MLKTIIVIILTIVATIFLVPSVLVLAYNLVLGIAGIILGGIIAATDVFVARCKEVKIVRN